MVSYKPDWIQPKKWKVDGTGNIVDGIDGGDILSFKGTGVSTDTELINETKSNTTWASGFSYTSSRNNVANAPHGNFSYTIQHNSVVAPAKAQLTFTQHSGGATWTAQEQ